PGRRLHLLARKRLPPTEWAMPWGRAGFWPWCPNQSLSNTTPAGPVTGLALAVTGSPAAAGAVDPRQQRPLAHHAHQRRESNVGIPRDHGGATSRRAVSSGRRNTRWVLGLRWGVVGRGRCRRRRSASSSRG